MLVYVQIKEMEKVLISELIGASVLIRAAGGKPFPQNLSDIEFGRLRWNFSLSSFFHSISVI